MEKAKLHLSTISNLHSTSFVPRSGLTLPNTSSSATITLPVLWHTDVIPSIHASSPSKVQNNEFRRISCHMTHWNKSYNLKSVPSTLSWEEDPNVWMLELVPTQEHSPFRCTTRDVNTQDLYSTHLHDGCRMSDTSRGRRSCTIRPLSEHQKNLYSSS